MTENKLALERARYLQAHPENIPDPNIRWSHVLNTVFFRDSGIHYPLPAKRPEFSVIELNPGEEAFTRLTGEAAETPHTILLPSDRFVAQVLEQGVILLGLNPDQNPKVVVGNGDITKEAKRLADSNRDLIDLVLLSSASLVQDVLEEAIYWTHRALRKNGLFVVQTENPNPLKMLKQIFESDPALTHHHGRDIQVIHVK